MVQPAAHLLALWQQQMVFDVEDAGGVVRALHRPAQPQEPVAVIAQHGAARRAIEHQGQPLNPFQETGEALAAHAGGLHALQLMPGVVQALPHLGGQGGAYGAAVRPGGGQAGIDRRGVVRVEGQKVANRPLGGRLALGIERLGHARGGDHALPGVGSGLGGGHGREPQGGIQDARQEIRALQIARGPEQAVGRAREHQAGSKVRPDGPRRVMGLAVLRENAAAARRPKCARCTIALTPRAPRCPWCRRPGWS